MRSSALEKVIKEGDNPVDHLTSRATSRINYDSRVGLFESTTQKSW